MRLEELVKRMSYTVLKGTLDREIGGICYDTRSVKKQDAFVCIAGAHFDSHDKAEELSQTAEVLIVEKEVSVTGGATVLLVSSTRLALAQISAAWFGHPAEELLTIGVTGTKGKTTTTHMIRTIFEAEGKKTGLIGTNGIYIGEEHVPTKNTTPESYEIQETLRRMADAGCDCVVMEVSSQGIMLSRVAGFVFDYGIFTNIAPDHIGTDEHSSFEEYLHYKGRLLSMCRQGLGNVDDAHWAEIMQGHSCELATFGVEGKADYRASSIHYLAEGDFMGIAFDVSGRCAFRAEVGIPGMFNVYNALAAISVAVQAGVSEKAICQGLRRTRVDGRMEIVYASDRFSVIVDYAHNEVSMESLLTTLRDYRPGRLVCLFGCGGNRSRLRRYGMGEIGGRMADLSILTADNSRFEEVEDILADIKVGMARTSGAFLEIPDRREAIFYAIHNACEGDMIVMIGKGHEDYQEIRGVRYPFLDSAVALEALKAEGLV